jgi:lipoate-protein ligase A
MRTAAPDQRRGKKGHRVSVVRVLPELRAAGGAQMALDAGLLDTAEGVLARRYTWAPPAVSVGKFQSVPAAAAELPFTVVRRPTGGRAVLHGEGFEWSFAVVFPPGAPGAHGPDPATPYDAVAGAFAGAFGDRELSLDASREESYRHSPLCFASALRHDLFARGEKVVAIAQARRRGRVLVHGSVLERRPPDELIEAVERLFAEPWRGEGLAGAGAMLAPEMIWTRVLVRLEAALRGLT